jgi:hypothetical protein
VKHDFNRVEIEGHPSDVFEQAMANFEGELAPALTRILQAGNLRNTEDRAILLNFIGLIAVRKPCGAAPAFTRYLSFGATIHSRLSAVCPPPPRSTGEVLPVSTE